MDRRPDEPTAVEWSRLELQQIADSMTKEVVFEPIDGAINARIDAAYRAKYGGSPYLKPMIGTLHDQRRSE